MTVTQTERAGETRAGAGGPAAADPATVGSTERVGPRASPVPSVCVAPPEWPRPDGADHYGISEVAAWTGLSAHTIRWYERIGLMPHIDRSHTGRRTFRNRDLAWLDLLAKLRATRMPVAAMLHYAELVQRGADTTAEREALLRATRADALRQIARLQEAVGVLDHKIAGYENAR